MNPNAPNLFILGAPKCGTTSISSWLDQHPDIFMTSPKEPGFFNDDYKDGAFRGKVNSYYKQFDTRDNFKYFCDGTVDYLASKNAISNIVKRCGESLFIVSVRAHADLLFSLHQQECVSGNESIYNFEEAFFKCPDRRAGRYIPITRPELKKIDYEERARIGFQLMRVLEYVPRNRILLLDFDLIKNDSETAWTGLCDFLGVEYTPVNLVASNVRKEVGSYFFTVVRNYLRKIKRRLGLYNERRFSDLVKKTMDRADTARQGMSPEMREFIVNKYKWDKRLIVEFCRSGPSLYLPDGWMSDEV